MVVPAFRSYTRLGENIYVFGFPVFPFLSSSGNFTAGTVTALAGPRDDSGLVQISAPVQPGNSGGPLLDKYGNVVGVVVGKIDALQNVNFAIKSGIVLNFLFSNRAATKQVEASRELPSEEIAELANSFSVRVLCYNAPKPSGIAQGTNPSGEPRQGIGGPYVPVPPDAIIGSYWTYNESLFALQWSGENRKFVYEKPRANLVSMGVTKGTVLFDGKKEGDIYVGTAHTFSQSCGATPYPVRGNITDDLLVTLRGQLPVLDDACKVRRYQDNVLKFRYRGKSP
jgi:hypothetical protein